MFNIFVLTKWDFSYNSFRITLRSEYFNNRILKYQNLVAFSLENKTWKNTVTVRESEICA